MVFEFVFVKYVALKKNIFNTVNATHVISFFGGGGGVVCGPFSENVQTMKKVDELIKLDQLGLHIRWNALSVNN